MDRCPDNRFRDFFHAYELGLLDDKEIRLLEQHLIECEFCLREAQRSESAALLLRTDPEVRAAVGRMAKGDRVGVPGRAPRRLRPATWISLAAVAVLMLLILRPWRVEIHSTDETMADQLRLVVMPFETGSSDSSASQLCAMVTSLLITDLSEQPGLNVLSSQRVVETRAWLARRATTSPIEPGTLALAEELGARWLVTGSVGAVDSGYNVNYELTEVASGRAIGGGLIHAGAPADVFRLTDLITAGVRASLPSLVGPAPAIDPQVAEVTTHSADAYWHYLRGVEQLSQFYYAEAVTSLKSALELDPGFAMAFYQLAALEDWRLIDSAVAYSHRVSHRERLLIESRAALYRRDNAGYVEALRNLVKLCPADCEPYYLLGVHYGSRGRLDTAVVLMEYAVKVNPLYKSAYNQLAWYQNRLGDYEQALAAVNKYVELAPEEANPYDTRGDIYAENGRLDKAIESYQQALRIKPDFPFTLSKLANLHLYRREYGEAERLYLVPVGASGEPRLGLERDLANLAICRGQLAAAEQMLAAVSGARCNDSLTGDLAFHQVATLRRQAQLRLEWDAESALPLITEAVRLVQRALPEQYWLCSELQLMILERNGRLGQSDSLLSWLDERSKNSSVGLSVFHRALALSKLERGDAEAAVTLLTPEGESTAKADDFAIHFHLARAQLAAGRLAEAVAGFEDLMSVYSASRMGECVWNIKMHYYLGLAYEASRWPDKAMAQYEMFLSYWGGPDVVIPEVADAQRRLVHLRE